MRYVILLAALTCMTGAACGGGASASLTSYFTELEEINNDIRSRQQQLDSEYDATLTATTYSTTVRDGFAEYLTQQRDLAREYVEEAGELEPPEEAATLHAASLDAYSDFALAMEFVIPTVNSARTLDTLVGALGNTAAVEAAALTTGTCLALQQLADGEDVSVDLKCRA